jgi:hypothetical protein
VALFRSCTPIRRKLVDNNLPMDLLTIRPYLIFVVLICLGIWYFNRDRMSLSVIASVLLGLTAIVFLVIVIPAMGFFLLIGLTAGCLLALILAVCRRFA